MHYLVVTRIDEHDDFVKDVSDYEDISDLYLMSDALVTDYSSVMFDFGVLKRPQIFYAYDLDKYGDELRGFYMDYKKELPGPIVENQTALIDALKQIDETTNEYIEARTVFYQNSVHSKWTRVSNKFAKRFLSDNLKTIKNYKLIS